MSLYSKEEICRDCLNAVYCEKCGALEYCKENAMDMVDGIRGFCDQRKSAAQSSATQHTTGVSQKPEIN